MITVDAESMKVISAVKDWREARCSRPLPKELRDQLPDNEADQWCDGDNHTENCPVQLATQDLRSVYDRWERISGTKKPT